MAIKVKTGSHSRILSVGSYRPKRLVMNSEIVDRIAYLFANPDVAKKMGEAGRNWVTQEWTWDQNFKKLDGLLSGLDFSD